jgi:hypothetical protein
MKKIVTAINAFRPYKPLPHPMQHRLDEFRAIPSLVTGGR